MKTLRKAKKACWVTRVWTSEKYRVTVDDKRKSSSVLSLGISFSDLSPKIDQASTLNGQAGQANDAQIGNGDTRSLYLLERRERGLQRYTATYRSSLTKPGAYCMPSCPRSGGTLTELRGFCSVSSGASLVWVGDFTFWCMSLNFSEWL